MIDITSLVNYYVNLLIIQYNQKPKATATIRALVAQLFANGIIEEVDNGFNLDTAVGKQLDIIGKYVGVDRFYSQIDLEDYFAFTDYDEIDPDADLKYGFCDYDTFEDDSLNGTLTYSSVVSRANALNDSDFRTLIRLKILQNNSNHSHQSITDGLYALFQNSVYVVSAGDMQISYVIGKSMEGLIRLAYAKGVLPRPMGVEITSIDVLPDDFIIPPGGAFGFATYTSTPPENRGFQTYATYGTVPGGILTYESFLG